jgi:hypothetical protein
MISLELAKGSICNERLHLNQGFFENEKLVRVDHEAVSPCRPALVERKDVYEVAARARYSP